MESPGITFEVQWKKKPGAVSRKEDVTSIGLWDPDDSTLDWKTFKSYVCQNLGTVEDITVAYVDSEGDELPIESECEFQEALKFARQRARKGRETVLKVDRQGSPSTSPVTKTSENILPCTGKSILLRCDKQKHTKPASKALHKLAHLNLSSAGVRAVPEERKLKAKKRSTCSDHQITEQEKLRVEKMELVSKLMEDLKIPSTETEDSPPPWFKKYMHKMKAEIVTEVTARVLHGMQQMVNNKSNCCCSSSDRLGTEWLSVKNKKKKRLSDEDSSDGALGSDTRDHKLLKKIEKLHKREKKLEKKLDSKLEKLENKTKRMMEKKSQSKARCERVPEKKVCFGSKKRNGDVLVGTYLMDAILLNDGPKPEIHIRPGDHFTKIWEIMNTGTLPWTDKTELRQAWGTLGLEPEETVVKCPILEPGEKGQIAVTFRAPEFAGTFESYWHFYHMGDRFGHWIGCAVVVDSKEEQADKPQGFVQNELVDDNKSRTERPVDLTMKSKPEQLSNNTYTDCVDQMRSSQVERESTTKHIRDTKDPEYESDSDSDNLSVISGTVTLSSDSEEEENFVVVPMPACFLCDVPLGSVDTVPVVMKDNIENKPQRTVTVMNTTGMTIKIPNDIASTNSEEQKVLNVEPESVPVDSECRPEERVFAIDMAGHCQDISFENIQQKRIFVVDMSGHCIPVEPNHYPVHSSVSNTSHEQLSENFGWPETRQKSEPCNISFNASTSIHTNICPPTSTESATSVESSDNNNTTSTATATSPSAHDQLGNVIHILPETLVTGAVNVATSAFSTARAYISNLRSKQPGEVMDWNWNSTGSSSVPSPTDRSTTESLKLLVEMGFTNKILNVLLLQRFDNDVAKVVAELLA